MRHRPDASKHPWEMIFAQDGRVFNEELPALQEAADKFSQRGFQTVLDLGCGNGRHVVGFAALGFDVIGLDISKTGLRLTRQWVEERELSAYLVQADTRYPLPLPDDAVEAIFSTQVIHHALQAEVFLAISEIHRVLKPGGLAFITVPCRSRSHRPSQQLEKHTFLPQEGSEAGLPHHIFSKRRLRRAFQIFQIQHISRRDDGRLLAIWVKKASSISPGRLWSVKTQT